MRIIEYSELLIGVNAHLIGEHARYLTVYQLNSEQHFWHARSCSSIILEHITHTAPKN